MRKGSIYIETDRLILRHFRSDDGPAVYSIFSDAEMNTFLPWFPMCEMSEADEWLDNKMAEYNSGWPYYYAICRREDDKPVGYIGMSNGDAHDLGYGLAKAFWHKGIMSEAARAFVAMLRSDEIPFITATHDVNNPYSGAVMRAVGMKYMYSYRERWMPKDIMVIFNMYQLNLNCDNDYVYTDYLNKFERVCVEGLKSEVFE